MFDFQHYEHTVPYLDEVMPPSPSLVEPPAITGTIGAGRLISSMIESPEGRTALAKAMVEPIKMRIAHKLA